MNMLARLALSILFVIAVAGCGRFDTGGGTATTAPAPGTGNATPVDQPNPVEVTPAPAPTGHSHGPEADLGTTMVGDHKVTCGQGHGAVAAGKLGHIVVKLPYNDNGATTVRAWIGTADRDLWAVGKGIYAPSHDDYDIHAAAPAPLPEGAQWWIEITSPDGEVSTGSINFM